MYLPSVSFCIITNGLRPDSLDATIASIKSLNIPDLEIIVGGELPAGFSNANIQVVSVIGAAREGRLGEMRNRIKSQATKNIVVICDDDLIFQSDFYSGLCNYGPDFDIQCVRFLNPDGSRYWDWAVVDSPDGHHLIEYSETSDFVYITGGLCILNGAIKDKIDWPEQKGFYEAEDVYFTKLVRQMGLRITCNPFSSVIHDDPRMSQIEDFALRIDSPFKWQLHPSGVLIKGANPGSPKSFSVRKHFEIEVPVSQLTTNRVLSLCISQFGDLKQFISQSQSFKISYADSIVDQFSFSQNLTTRVLNFKLPKSSIPLKFVIEAEGEILSSWYHHPRDRVFVAGMVSDLKLDQDIGINQKSPEKKKSLLESLRQKNEEDSNDKTKNGMTLSIPFATGNPLTRTIRSLILELQKSCKSLSIIPRICEKRLLNEIHQNKFENDLWLGLITNNVKPSSHIEFLADYLGDVSLYKSSLASTHYKEVENLNFIDTSKDTSYKDERFGVTLKSKNHKHFLPFSIDKKKFHPSNFEPSIQKANQKHTIIGLEIDKDDLTFLPSTLKILTDLNLSKKIELVAFSSEIKSNRVGKELGQIIQESCEKHGISLDLLPETICLSEVPNDQEICGIYKSLDLLIQTKTESNFSYKLLPLAMSCKVFTFESSKYQNELNQYGVICIDENSLKDQIQEHLNFQKYNIQSDISKLILEKYDSLAISKIWIRVFKDLGAAPQIQETKIIELTEELTVPIIAVNKPQTDTRKVPAILLDMRSIFGLEENLVRGIGKYSLSHAFTLLKKCPEWKFYVLVNDSLYFEQVTSLLPFRNAIPESLSKPSGNNFDLVLVYDPMGNSLGYHNPFLIYPEVPHSAILYDLIPLEEENHFDANDHKQIAAYNLALNFLNTSKPHLLAISNHSRDVAIDLLQYDHKLIDVINGAPALAFPIAYNQTNPIHSDKWDFTNQTKPFFMTVGSLEPRKNFHHAFNSFILASSDVDIDLIVVGSMIDPFKVYYENEFKKAGINNIKFIGLLSDEELSQCYSKASGLLFLSQFEGLGLPPIEAMKYNCPVITSNQSCLPETVGAKGLAFDPADINGISQAIVKLVTNDEFRESVIENGSLQVKKYNWNETIVETIKAWEKHWDIFRDWNVARTGKTDRSEYLKLGRHL